MSHQLGNTLRQVIAMHSIQRYEVIPLSPNSGLIEWVPHCDTLHSLIRDYRESRKIPLNIEHRLMLQMAPDYDNLMLIQKVEVFDYALESTAGQDLYKVLWLKSPNSEVWLDRRTNYTRSLAVMSMVGYILGLGDRHPSNLMLDRWVVVGVGVGGRAWVWVVGVHGCRWGVVGVGIESHVYARDLSLSFFTCTHTHMVAGSRARFSTLISGTALRWP